jgi:hypothetical protein
MLAKSFGRDAKADMRRSIGYALAATTAMSTGAVWGSIQVTQADHPIGASISIAALFAATSAPLWWLADRYRRSGLEHRRMKRHVQSFAPYLDGFDDASQIVMRAALGQRLFANTREDTDPLREPIWPTPDAILGSIAEQGSSPTDSKRGLRWLHPRSS